MLNPCPDVLPISAYGAIGNLRTVALVGSQGSIDWCCFPQLDGPSVFAALLDRERGGHFRVAVQNSHRGQQRYLPHTNVLETTFHGEHGRLRVTDFMPLSGDIRGRGKSTAPPEICRVLDCDGESVAVEVEWSPRFDYAQAQVEIREVAGGYLAEAHGHQMTLAHLPHPARLVETPHGPSLQARFPLRQGERVVLVTRWGTADAGCDEAQVRAALQSTIDLWQQWSRNLEAEQAQHWAKSWYDHVIRSELALKLLTNADTGAIAAAATTSLPEVLGGIRNWDYRFTWIRDAGMTIDALMALGHRQEAHDFLEFAERVSQQHRERGHQTQIMYGLHGEDDAPELELEHLAGYCDSRPVRIGNAAFKQTQHDLYGELLTAAYELVEMGENLSSTAWQYLGHLADRACEVWHEPDDGLWEPRHGPQHNVYSKVLVWAGLDRAIQLAEQRNLRGNVARWQRNRALLRDQILEQGYNRSVGAFTAWYGSDELDAANLVIPLEGLLPFDDPRVVSTVERTLEHLTVEGLVYRYHWDDGLPGDEGAMGLCTFWLIDALAGIGRVDEAQDLFERMLSRSSPLGLYSEQIDPRSGMFLGNFPQAFTHIGLINSALRLACHHRDTLQHLPDELRQQLLARCRPRIQLTASSTGSP